MSQNHFSDALHSNLIGVNRSLTSSCEVFSHSFKPPPETAFEGRVIMRWRAAQSEQIVVLRCTPRRENEFNDSWRRVQILSVNKAPYQMPSAVEDIRGASAPTGRVAELCTVLESVDCNALSVDFRDAQRRVSHWRIRIAGCSADVEQGKTGARRVRSARYEGRTRIYKLRIERQSGRGTRDPYYEGSYRGNYSNPEGSHCFFLSRRHMRAEPLSYSIQRRE